MTVSFLKHLLTAYVSSLVTLLFVGVIWAAKAYGAKVLLGAAILFSTFVRIVS